MTWHLDALTTLRGVLLSSLWAALVIATPWAGISAHWGLPRTRAAHSTSRGSLGVFFFVWASTLAVLNAAAAPRLVISDPDSARVWLPMLLDGSAFWGALPEGLAAARWGPWEVVWLAGFAVSLARVTADLWRMKRRLRSTQPLRLESVIGARDTRLETHMKAARIAVRTSHRVHQPCALGFWRPTILVPVRFLEDFPAPERSALLAHEVAHLDRHDVPKNLALHLLGAVLWFNPGFLFLRLAYIRSRELACDVRACRYLDSPVALARALERVARAEPSPLPGLASLGGGCALLTRVRALVGRSPPLPLRRGVAGAAVVLASASFGVVTAQVTASTYFRERSRDSYLSAERLDLDQFTADVCTLLRDDGLYETDQFGGGYGPVSLTVRDREAVINGSRVPSPTQERLRSIFADHGVRWREETFLRFYQADSEVGHRAGSARVGERIGTGRWLKNVPEEL